MKRLESDLSATPNPDYRHADADGTQLPFLDRIEYRPTIEETSRLTALESGRPQALHGNNASTFDNPTARRAVATAALATGHPVSGMWIDQ